MREIVLLSREEFRARRKDQPGPDEPVAVTISDHDFLWECPGCGFVYWGPLADEPRSGWEDPAWKLTDGPTLTPSLGCSRWRNGHCPDGHWWLRDGSLVRA